MLPEDDEGDGNGRPLLARRGDDEGDGNGRLLGDRRRMGDRGDGNRRGVLRARKYLRVA
jgi:hypothetical protein